MRLRLRSLLVLAIAALGGPVACIPYTVGTTAQPVPIGESRTVVSAYRIPKGLDVFGDDSSDSDNADFGGIDLERRIGVSEGLDVGIRIPSFSGVVVTAKKRIAGGLGTEDAALSVMPGIGVLNWLSHLHGEVTLMASAPRRSGITPYGGLRVMQVLPLDGRSAHDSPTAGGYLGFRFGNEDAAITPELGIYHDRSTLELRERNVIFVPSITIEGDLFPRRRVGGWFRSLRRTR